MDTIQAGSSSSSSSSDSSSGSNSVSATECGHVFHEACLQRWLAASRSCPTCRKPLRAHGIVKLFLDAADVLPGGCISNDGGPLQLLQRELSEVRSQLKATAVAEKRQQEATSALRSRMRQIEGVARTYNAKYVNALHENCHLRTQLRGLREEVRDKRHLRTENIFLQTRLHAKERQLQTVTDSRSQLNREALDLRKKVAYLEVLARERVAHIRALEGDVNHLKDMLHRAELNAESGNTSASTNAHDGPIAERQLLEMSEEFRNRMECVMGSLSAELGLHEAQLRQQAQHAQARREDADDARATLRCAEFRPRSLQQLHGNRKRLPHADEPNEPPQSVPGRAPKRPRL